MNPLKQIYAQINELNEIILNEMYYMLSEAVLIITCFIQRTKEDNSELKTMKYFKRVGENNFLFSSKWFSIKITKTVKNSED